MPNRHRTKPRLRCAHLSVLGKRCRGPERQDQVVVHAEEDHGAILELLARDALRLQAHPIAVEGKRPLEIIHAERQNVDPRLHTGSSPTDEASNNAPRPMWLELAERS